MRKKQTFLLTVMTSETGSSTFCGQIKVIASGKTSTFTSLEDLYRFLAGEMKEDSTPIPAKLNLTIGEKKVAL